MRTIQLLFFFLFSIVCWSQHSIEGIITDETGLPLKGAHVHIANKTTSTLPNGAFLLEKIPAGKQRLYISYIGYQPIDTVIVVDQNLTFNYQMVLDITKLNEVALLQLRKNNSASVVEEQITKATIEQYSNQTLGDALKEVAGVSILKTGSTIVKPVINGLHSSRIPIINNNVRLEDQQWGTEHAPNFDVNSAGKITVIKGASALQYGGDAIGGLVLIESEAVKKDTLFGKTIANFSSNGRGGSISSSIHKGNRLGWSWNMIGTLKYLGDRETPDYILSNTGNREQNFSGSTQYNAENYSIGGMYSFYNAQIGILQASHIGNVTDLYNAITNQEPFVVKPFTYGIDSPKQEVQHHLAKLNFKKWLSNDAVLDMQYAFQFNNRLEYDVRRNSENRKASLDLQLATHTLLVDYKKTFDHWQLKTGINLGYQNNFANPQTGVRPLIPSYQKIDLGTYVIGTYNIDNSMVLEGGLRYDFSTIEATKYYLKSRWEERGYDEEFSNFIVGEEGNQWLTKPKFDYHNLTGNLGFRKQFHHELEWFSNVSLASRNPNPSELFSDGLHHSTGQVELGDLRLEREQSFKFSNTLKKDWKKTNLSFTPFINRIANFIYLQPIGFETTIRGAFPVWEFKQTEALLTGIDLNFNWDVTQAFSYKSNFAYVNGENLTENQPLIDMPPVTWNQKLVFSNPKWYNFMASLQSELVFRQTRFPDYNFEANIVVNNELESVIVDISSSPAGYHLLHLYGELSFNLGKNNKITTALFIQNLTNTAYRDYLNRQRFYADEMGRNIQLQIKYNF
jgi:iron complex outermembrane receptor protein